MGCVHVPFHNRKLMKGVLDLMDTYNFAGIIIGGDFLDMASLSEYEKGKINHTWVKLDEEYGEANKLLDEFDKRISGEKVFLFGNHENRYFRWLADVNNNKYGDLINPIHSLNLEKRGYTVYSDYKNDKHKLGTLYILHGEFYNIHVAKKTLDTWRRNILFYHTHRMQVYREGEFCAYNGGCLADLSSPAFNYAPMSTKIKWANAFNLIHLDGKKHYVDTINCYDNSFVYAGVKYGG